MMSFDKELIRFDSMPNPFFSYPDGDKWPVNYFVECEPALKAFLGGFCCFLGTMRAQKKISPIVS
jgi:hypothetical protein